MKIWHLLLSTTLLILSFSHLKAQKSLRGIAKIEVFDESGNLLETGSGIVAGSTGSQFFIATAFHVIDQGEKVLVTFYDRQFEQFTASIHPQFNPDLDYAVLIVNAPVNKIRVNEFRQPDFKRLKSGQKVKSVGHPSGEDWTYNIQNVITNPQFSTFEISFSNIGIAPGYSGGALLNGKKDQLIGLIVNTETQNTVAVQIDQVLRDLKSWGIPNNYILPYKPPRRPSSYVFAVLSAGAAVGATYLHFQAEDQYSIYEQNRDPNANGIYDSKSREQHYNDANNFKDLRNYSAVGSGGLTLLSVLLSGRKYKEPKKDRKK